MLILLGPVSFRIPGRKLLLQSPPCGEEPPARHAGGHALDRPDLVVPEIVPKSQGERLAQVVGQLDDRPLGRLAELAILGPTPGGWGAVQDELGEFLPVIPPVASLLAPEVSADRVEPGPQRDVQSDPVNRDPECREGLLSQVGRPVG